MSFQIAVQCVWSLLPLVLVGIDAAAVDFPSDDTSTSDNTDSYWHRYYPLTSGYQGDDIKGRQPPMQLNNITWANGPTDIPDDAARFIYSSMILDNSHGVFHFDDMSLFLMIGNFLSGPILRYTRGDTSLPAGLKMDIIEGGGFYVLIIYFWTSTATLHVRLPPTGRAAPPYWVHVGFTCQRRRDDNDNAACKYSRFSCKIYVDAEVKKERHICMDMEDITSPDRILFGHDGEKEISLSADMACVVFDKTAMSVDEIRKHMDMCGSELEPHYPPCYDVANCHCSTITECSMTVDYIVCILPPCKGCRSDEACCCPELF